MLPTSTKTKIEKEAEAYAIKCHPNEKMITFREYTKRDYKHGATSEAKRSQQLVEALYESDQLLAYFEDFTHGRDGDKITNMRYQIQQALSNYNK